MAKEIGHHNRDSSRTSLPSPRFKAENNTQGSQSK